MELLLKVHIAKQQPHGSYSQNTAAFQVLRNYVSEQRSCYDCQWRQYAGIVFFHEFQYGYADQDAAAYAHGKLLQKRNQLAGKFRKGMPLKALLYIKYDEWNEHNQRCAEQRLKLQYLKDAEFRAAKRAYGSGRIISGHKH